MYHPDIVAVDRFALEHPIFGIFQADLVVADSENAAYLFVEFENAASDSIFKKDQRTTTYWTSRFLGGFAQLVDWFGRLEDESSTGKFSHIFGGRQPRLVAMLVIGRDPRPSRSSAGRFAALLGRWAASPRRACMQTHLIAVPYDSALRGWRMGAGPERLLNGILGDELRAAGHQVRIEYIEADSDGPAEIRTAFELNRALAGRIREAREADALPVVLAGNCMTAVGTLAGLGGTPAVLWFDAHGDFNTPETTVSGFLDGMALATLTGRCWANLARTVHGFQPVPECDVVLLGARELDAGERVLLDGSEMALLAPEQARTQLAPVLAKLSGREAYVHLDLDALDPAEGRANGLAVPGGFTVDEACAALEQIGDALRVRAVALTAYDPIYDPEGRICRIASRLLGTLLSAISDPAAQQSLADDEGRSMPPE